MADIPAATTNPISAPPLDGIASPTGRIASLDQFRGYTVAGMLLVNFLGGFAVVPAVLKHHSTYCSYADTIMPQFFFAVGFAYRLTFLKRLRSVGPRAATAAAVRRNLGLIVLGAVLYHLDGGAKSWADLTALGPVGFATTAFQRMVFQTLVHIALASLWALPVIATRPPARVGYLVLSAALHLGLSRWFYFDWAWERPVIDGGPLGFLSWSVPLLVGSLAFDAVARGGEGLLRRLAGWSLVLMALGYGLSCLGGAPAAPPFVAPAGPVNLWTMSQRTGSISYQTFASGFSLLACAAFVAACDRGGLRVGLFRTFGRNALAAYVLHDLVAGAVNPYVPRDAPGWYVAVGSLLYFGISYGLVRGLEKQGVFIKL
jgi:predicted acyltransferase